MLKDCAHIGCVIVYETTNCPLCRELEERVKDRADLQSYEDEVTRLRKQLAAIRELMLPIELLPIEPPAEKEA